MVVALTDELLIDETELPDDDEPQHIHYEITSFPTDFTVKVMYEKWSSGQLEIPDFQRRYVWSLPQASRFIESFLLGLPIPQVFLYRKHANPKFIVVDGQQRLATIAKFYTGQFSETRVFRLSGVDARWNNKTYLELSEDDRLALDDSAFRSIVIQQIQPDDNSSIYQIFERLNTGGTSLNAMEIRKAIFHGPAYDLLDQLNHNHAWRQLIGTPLPDKRLRDVELILRILALASGWKDYTKPMKSFLTNHMDATSKITASEISQVGNQFEIACNRVHSTLGDKPFHLRSRMDVAALDSIMANAFNLSESLDKIDIKAKYKELRSDTDFITTVTFDTSDSSIVRKRFGIVHSTLNS